LTKGSQGPGPLKVLTCWRLGLSMPAGTPERQGTVLTKSCRAPCRPVVLDDWRSLVPPSAEISTNPQTPCPQLLLVLPLRGRIHFPIRPAAKPAPGGPWP
jgi:hypothetical protein